MRKRLCGCFIVMIALVSSQAFAGSFSALAPGGVIGDEQTTLVYEQSTGELKLDAPASTNLTSIFVTSASNAFIGDKPPVLDGPFDSFAADNIFKSTIGSSFGDLSFGNVLATGLSHDQVLNDLTASGSLDGGGGLGDVDFIHVPEPASLIMLGLALVGLVGLRRRR